MTVTIKKTEKAERLGIRLLPKEKFSIELLALKQGKSITAIIKDALDSALRHRDTGLIKQGPDGETFYLPDVCWHPIESDRVINLGQCAPEMMNDQQLVVWKLVCEEPEYWTDDKQPDRKKIKKNWLKINLAAVNMLKEAE
jgi:hypothetical protein